MKQIVFNGNKNIVGKMVAEYRKKEGLSQGELAAKMQLMNVNIDQQMISKIEKNQRQVTDYEFACFCKCLKASPNELLKYFDYYLD
ncbi:MAG: helix-turn-helix domain-containing protein [Eubacterium sp.]|nr:helix-turn-helix domain-containing protein [Eubacterium sp.]MDE6469974.1 helix-turn-helix domain-containing protein [Eubacterium sp.]